MQQVFGVAGFASVLVICFSRRVRFSPDVRNALQAMFVGEDNPFVHFIMEPLAFTSSTLQFTNYNFSAALPVPVVTAPPF